MYTMRVKTAGGTIAAPALPTGTAAYTSSYLHHDQLGSVVAITSTAGVVVERLAYDPWGKRRFASGATTGNPDTLDAITGQYIDRGFTMHEHIDEMGIINMNGRIYDPLIGRFMSADPYIQAPDDLQSHNRYAYVMNNPLNLTDPSGYNWLTKTWKKAWKSPIFRAVLGIVVAVVAPAFLVQFGGALFGATIGGVTTLSFAGSVAVGGLSGFAATGTLKGALTGAFTAGLMHGVGTLGNELGLQSGGVGKVALHAGAGCISSVAGGGGCKTGALSGALGELGNNLPTNDVVLGTVKASMLGGIGAKIGGGKFADGAVTGAFGYLFNECQHTRACGSDSTKIEVAGNRVVGTLAHTEIQISSGYEFTVLEGQAGVNLKGSNTSYFTSGGGGGEGASNGSAFVVNIVAQNGDNQAALAMRMKEGASLYKNDVLYGIPSPANTQIMLNKSYNSNSYVGGVIDYASPNSGNRSMIQFVAGTRGYAVPGMENPLPLKR
jgi:RHS repeat-associated protein